MEQNHALNLLHWFNLWIFDWRSPVPRPASVAITDANRVVFAAHSDLYLTTDGFASETKLFSAGKKFNDIVFAPSDPSVVWLIAEGYLLYKSTDSGASFTLTKNLRSGVLNAGG